MPTTTGTLNPADDNVHERAVSSACHENDVSSYSPTTMTTTTDDTVTAPAPTDPNHHRPGDSNDATTNDDHWAYSSSLGYTPLLDMNLMTTTTTIQIMAADDDQDSSEPLPTRLLFSTGVSGTTTVSGAFWADLTGFDGEPDNDTSSSSSNEDDDNDDDNDDNNNSSAVEDFRAIADQALRALEADYASTLQANKVLSSSLEEEERSTELPWSDRMDHGMNNRNDSHHEPYYSVVADASDDGHVDLRATFIDQQHFDEAEASTGTNVRPTVASKDDDDSTPTSTAATTTTTTTTVTTIQQVDNTEAIRRAVQTIRLRDPQLTTALHSWELAQKEATARPPPLYHSLIPSNVLSAFSYKSSSSSSTNNACISAQWTRSATLAEAVIRLNLLRQQDIVRIHVLGCDAVECGTVDRIQRHFSPVARWIAANPHAPQQLQLFMLGPNIPTTTTTTTTTTMQRRTGQQPIDLLAGRSTKDTTTTATTTTTTTTTTTSDAWDDAGGVRNRLKQAHAFCHATVYDEWMGSTGTSDDDDDDETTTATTTTTTRAWPDLIIAFNAGVWGYQEWPPTIQSILSLEKKRARIPFVVTAYTLQEADDDFDVIQNEVAKYCCSTSNKDDDNIPKGEKEERTMVAPCCLWEPEINTYASQQDRPTPSALPAGRRYRENHAWQAWKL